MDADKMDRESPDLDLYAMELHELKKLQREVEVAINDYARRQMRVALQEIEDVAKKHGLTLDDISSARKFTRTRGPRKETQLYRNPKDPAKIWTGRGRRPHWFDEALASGVTREEMLIKS